jgi:ribonuclease VapC
MIIDTSALVAILTAEAQAAALSVRVARAGRAVVPAHVLLEASMVLAGRKTPEELPDLDAYLARIGAEVLPFTAAHAEAARLAFLRYGKGRDPAGLNFGDCMSYAVARVEALPLLFVGQDFARTDVAAA